MSALTLINSKGRSTRVERPSFTNETGGGQLQTFGFVALEKVWIQPTSADSVRLYGSEYMASTHQGFARVGSVIQDGDELVQDGERFKVDGFYDAGRIQTGRIAHCVLALSRTEGVT